MKISYVTIVLVLAILWFITRTILLIWKKKLDLPQEVKILFGYICAVVILRFTFFEFGLVEGHIQPLVIDVNNMYPFRMNWVPFIHLFDYEGSLRDTLINVIGNTAMFIPVGIILPIIFPRLNSRKKVIFAGFCISLCIEIVQLPLASRVSDIDDLILNTLGCCLGCLLFYAFWRVHPLQNRIET